MSPDASSISVADRLNNEFCPPLDSSLLAALLLDFPDPSADDEAAIRQILVSLCEDIDYELDTGSSAGTGSQGDDRSSVQAPPSMSEVESLLEAWTLEEKRDEEAVSVEKVGEGALRDDPYAFLRSVFPRMSQEAIRKRLEKSKDLETLVEELLNEDFISSSASEAVNSTFGPPSQPKSKPPSSSKQRQRLRASQTISLTSPTLRSASPSSNHTETVSLLSTAAAPSVPNRWISVDSTSHYLSGLLRLTPGEVTSSYHNHASSLPLTLDALMFTLASTRPFEDLPSPDVLLETLQMLLPQKKVSDLKVLLSATEGDVSDALDLSQFLERVEREEGGVVANGLVGFGSKKRVGAPPVSLNSPRSSPALGSNFTLISRGSQKDITPMSEQRYTPAECAELALSYQDKRNTAFRAAARHFQKGGMGERGAAWHWAEVGREHDRRKREWEGRGAFAIVGERRRRGEAQTVDLHGLTLQHALSVVKECTSQWWSGHASSLSPFRIITGVGKHSTNQNPVLMPAVIKLLDREGWIWKWDGFSRGGAGGGHGAVIITGLR